MWNLVAGVAAGAVVLVGIVPIPIVFVQRLDVSSDRRANILK